MREGRKREHKGREGRGWTPPGFELVTGLVLSEPL